MPFKSVLKSSVTNPFRVCGELILGAQVPSLMGIINRTPDSFFDGGHFESDDEAFERALEMLDSEVKIIDVGGESSRPGALPVSESEEIKRIIPLIKRLHSLTSSRNFFISVDTVKSSVAKAAIEAGAHIVNDISALSFDPNMKFLIRDSGVSCVLNHIRGGFGTMQNDFTPYNDVVSEVRKELLLAAHALLDLGVPKDTICLDPGIGFGKTPKNNLDLISSVEDFLSTGHPILLGMSRKSFIGSIPKLSGSSRLFPSLTVAIIAALGGATLLRVHDVRETFESLAMLEAFRQ